MDINGVPPSMDGFCQGEFHLDMDENRSYPHVRKCTYSTKNIKKQTCIKMFVHLRTHSQRASAIGAFTGDLGSDIVQSW